MAIYTSTQTGTWASSSTWGGSGPPAAGDRAIIKHAVTISSAQAQVVGNSPPSELSGTGTLASDGGDSTILVGTGTSFITELQVGYFLKVGSYSWAFIEQIIDNTHLKVNRDLGGGYSVSAGTPFSYMPTAVYMTGVNARLIINAPFTVRGSWGINHPSSTLTDTVTIGAGSGVEFDASQASSPSTTNYVFIPLGDPFQSTRIVINGTSGSRSYWRSNSGGGNSSWNKGPFYWGGYLYARYTDFTRIGTSSVLAIDIDTARPDSSFDVANCFFDSCGRITGENRVGGVGAICSIVNSTWRNSLADPSLTLPPSPAGGNNVWAGNVTDADIYGETIGWRIGGTGPNDWCVMDARSGMHSVTGATPAAWFRNVFKRNTKNDGNFICPGTIEDSYFLSDIRAPDIKNSHPCPINGAWPHDVLRCVIEGVEDDPDCDAIQGPASSGSTAGTWTVAFCLKLPNSIGRMTGTLTLANNEVVALLHNTFYLGARDGTNFGGVEIGEAGTGSYVGTVEPIEGNIFWDDPTLVTPQDFVFTSRVLPSSGAIVQDVCHPANFKLNGIFKAKTGTNNRIGGVDGQTLYGIDSTIWSTAPVAAAVTSNPQFVWQAESRAITETGFAAWAASLGATGTIKTSIDHPFTELAKKNDPTGYDSRYNVPDLLAWVRARYAPTNSAYSGITTGIDSLGATDAAGNSLAGTVGALALASSTPTLDLTNWEAAMEWARAAPHIYPSSYDPADVASLDGADHYDAIRVFQNLRDYTGDSTWDTKIAAAVLRNREGYLRPQGGSSQGHHAWNWGLARDYERAGSELSRITAIQVRRVAAFNRDDIDPVFFWSWTSSRETAFAILNHLAAEDMGHPSTARIHQLASWAMIHIDQWTWGATTSTHIGPRPFFLYVRPFMVGLTCEALIRYWDRYRNHPNCPPGIPGAVKSVIDWIWDNCWRESDQTFDYTDIDTAAYDTWTTGTVASTASDTVFAGDVSLSAANNYYVYGLLHFLTGARAGDIHWVTGYVGSTRSFTILGATGVSPAPGDTFLVSATGYASPGGSGGLGTTPALSLLIAPAYAWYYLYSGSDTYRARHDAIFAGSSPAALGLTTWTFSSQKEYNQSYRLSFQGLKWRTQGISSWPAATALTFTALDTPTGRANAWSGRFKVALSGSNVSVNGPVTLTFSDGGAGGTFRGGSIITTDRSYLVFNYRPPVGSHGQVITLSITSDNNTLTNPASLTYTVTGETQTSTGYVLTGPSSGPVDAPSDWFTLSLNPVNSVPPSGSFDATGGVVDIWVLDYISGTSDRATGTVKLEGGTDYGVGGVPLTDKISFQRFTYTSLTQGDLLGARTTAIRYPSHFTDPGIWPEPTALTYTAPSEFVIGSISFVYSGPSQIILSATDATGGSAPYFYQWQRSQNGGSYSNLSNGSGVSGATTRNLTDGSVTQGVLYSYRLIYTDSTPSVGTSNIVAVQAYPGGPLTTGNFSRGRIVNA